MRAILFLLLLGLAGCRASRPLTQAQQQARAAIIAQVREWVQREPGLDTGEFRWQYAHADDLGESWMVSVPLLPPGTEKIVFTEYSRHLTFFVDKASGQITVQPH